MFAGDLGVMGFVLPGAVTWKMEPELLGGAFAEHFNFVQDFAGVDGLVAKGTALAVAVTAPYLTRGQSGKVTLPEKVSGPYVQRDVQVASVAMDFDCGGEGIAGDWVAPRGLVSAIGNGLFCGATMFSQVASRLECVGFGFADVDLGYGRNMATPCSVKA